MLFATCTLDHTRVPACRCAHPIPVAYDLGHPDCTDFRRSQVEFTASQASGHGDTTLAWVLAALQISRHSHLHLHCYFSTHTRLVLRFANPSHLPLPPT